MFINHLLCGSTRMKTNGKYLLLLIGLLAALIYIILPAQQGFAAQATLASASTPTPTPTPTPKPATYQLIIDPPNNYRSLLFKGKLDGVEIKGWWLDVTINGQALETFLKTHPLFKVVIIAKDGKKTEFNAEQYLKVGLRFPYGNPTVSLFDDHGAPVFGDLKLQAGGEPASKQDVPT